MKRKVARERLRAMQTDLVDKEIEIQRERRLLDAKRVTIERREVQAELKEQSLMDREASVEATRESGLALLEIA
jgi:hypothetical protein